MNALLPENEAARLDALRRYHILDTLPEQAFDDITLLASQICETPIALISLVDGDRQWFKSKIGLDFTETSRDISFCTHAILQPDDLLIVPDARRDARFADNTLVTADPHIQFYAGAPLLTPSGEAVGTLCVLDAAPRVLNAMQQSCLRALARQVMAQFELRRLLLDTTEQMTMQQTLAARLHASERRFHAFMDNSPLVAFLKDAQGRYVYVNQPFLRRFHVTEDMVLERDDAAIWPAEIAASLREHDRSVLAGNGVVSLLERVPTPDGEPHYWQVYKFPLHQADQRYLGGIALDVTDTKRYEHQLEAYQQQLEEALARVEVQSLTDGLTDLANRRAFTRKLDEEFERAKRYGGALSLLMLDVDFFKIFNDTFGHPAGDELLQTVARLLEEEARATDMVARYGGEEFAIILPDTEREGAFMLAERFRRAVEAMPWRTRATTVSIGVASFVPSLATSSELLTMADTALYRAKHEGRNRVRQAT
jgi:diguanylate cyclase (GGDEF)-like protein/PAS domain S-box-containing protein